MENSDKIIIRRIIEDHDIFTGTLHKNNSHENDSLHHSVYNPFLKTREENKKSSFIFIYHNLLVYHLASWKHKKTLIIPLALLLDRRDCRSVLKHSFKSITVNLPYQCHMWIQSILVITKSHYLSYHLGGFVNQLSSLYSDLINDINQQYESLKKAI